MTVNSSDEWANAIESAEQVMLRWGHGQVRRVPDEIVTAIVTALKAPQSEQRRNTIKDAEDAIDLFLEYRDKHGRNEDDAKACAINEFYDAQAYDPETPVPELQPLSGATPRTDANEVHAGSLDAGTMVVFSDDARQLERRLREAERYADIATGRHSVAESRIAELEAALAKARDEALEEAAQRCEKTVYMGTEPTATGIKTTLIESEDWAKNTVGISYGAAIRAMKGKP